MTSPLLLLPGQPGFSQILATPLPIPGQNFICRAGSDVLEPVAAGSEAEREYFLSGEYDARLEEIESDILYLPCHVEFSLQG